MFYIEIVVKSLSLGNPMSKVINMNFKGAEHHRSCSLAKKVANILLFETLILWKENNITCLVNFSGTVSPACK